MLKTILLALFPTLLGVRVPPTHHLAVRADKAADDVLAAMTADDVQPADQRVLGPIAYVFGFHESAWQTAALGDGGRSCGVMQVQTPELWLTGATCDAVRKNRVLGFRVGIGLIRHLANKCGSLKMALSAYATDGQCHGWTPPLVPYRCKQAGLTANCEIKPTK